jgi:HPt (histidine-containing phosphotransfer) domain-containing protein
MKMDDLEITFALAQTRCNLDNDEELVRDMAEIFISDVPEMCRRLTTFYDQACDSPQVTEQILADVRHLAHSIKGLARTFGAEPLSTLTERIEKSPSDWLSSDGRFASLVSRVGIASATRLGKELGLSHAD